MLCLVGTLLEHTAWPGLALHTLASYALNVIARAVRRSGTCCRSVSVESRDLESLPHRVFEAALA